MNLPAVFTIGLISDTHFQDRSFDLPSGLGELWADVELILHAGDVGDLSVLDLLSKYAPTIAVHGNDEPDCVKQTLPDHQIVSVNGSRILLIHSHYADPIEEKAHRKGPWRPKLDRIARLGSDANAQIVVYGHTHVPMICRIHDVWLINPGALAAGSYFTRQVVKSVAKLHLFANGDIQIVHFDAVANRETVFEVPDPDEDFDVLAQRYQEWLVEPGLIPVIHALRKIDLEDKQAVVRTFVPLYKRCLTNGPMRSEDLIHTVNSGNLITPNDKKNILSTIYRNL